MRRHEPGRRDFRRWFRIALGMAALVTLASLPALRPATLTSGSAVAQEHGSDPHAADPEATHDTVHGEVAEDAAGHGEDAHGGEGAHGAEAHSEHPPELPNLITILHDRYVVKAIAEGRPPAAWAQFLHKWENQVFMLFFIIVLTSLAAIATRQLKHMPGSFQNGVEFVVQSLDDFVTGILGPHGRRLVPFLGTLFIFILVMNYAGLVPFLKSPTANLNTTLAMATCVFLYVQWTGIRSFGLLGYLDHLAGSPRDLVGFVLIPLMLPLHIVGELVKPMSLSLRLFGNITGEDVLLAVFVGLGVGLAGVFVHGAPFGVPIQAIVYPLLLIFGFIQALVFTLLSTIYFYMMLPHEEHH
jgi:F-type H+-transporting ATPase subunit a